MTSTAPQITSEAPAKELLRRCKWCVNRTGFIRIFDRERGNWIEIDAAVNHTLESILPITDTICPACLKISLHKIEQTKNQNKNQSHEN